MLRKFLLGVSILLAAVAAGGQQREEWRAWNQPVEPFRIIGNIYYVGTSEITSFLITSSEGHILLDGGFEESAPLIRASIEKLGFRLNDIRLLINSQAHSDHAGGLAELRKVTGAKLLLSKADAELAARGGADDFAFGDGSLYPPVVADAFVSDGQQVRVGTAMLTAHLTPGHTRGCTTWTTRSEGKDVIFFCSTTFPGYRLVGNEKYPEIADDFRASFAKLEKLRADVFLAAHGSFFALGKKREQLGGAKNPFVDASEYPAFLAKSKKAFEEELAKQTREQLAKE